MGYLLILLLVSLAASAVGWKYFFYFFSLGYGGGIVALSVAMMVIFRDVLTIETTLLCLALIFFGCRLAGYLLYREMKHKAYRAILHDPSLEKKKPLGVVISVWLFCALLYVGQVSPVAFRLASMRDGNAVTTTWAWIGLALIVGGTLLEACADLQKNAAKKVNSHRFVDKGLYRIVRCPNYLGGLVIWTGCFLSGIGACLSPSQWVIASVGYLGIVYVMFSGARRLELRQDEVYGENPEYQEYIKKTPIILPFIPLYSVKKYTWLQA
jgi:steroid 5-alpha reductase family enzyme